jgi:error-prone DNA polymerase
MPDKPPSSKRPPIVAAPRGRAAVRYAELHCKTNFSFLEGASHPDELVLRAAELDYTALAVTDRHSLAGVVRAHEAAKEVGLKLLIGAEIAPVDAPAVVLWVTDRASYGRLSQLITRGCRRCEKGQFEATLADIADHATGLLAGVLLTSCSGIRKNSDSLSSPLTSHPSRSLNSHEFSYDLSVALHRYREIFGDRCYALAELHCGPRDEQLLEEWIAATGEARVPLVASGDVYYHRRSRLPLADVLAATRLGCTVAEAGDALFPNAERYLKDPEELAARFARAPGAVERSCEIAARATFSLDELRYEYPEELAPAGQTPLEYLTRLAWAGAAERYPSGVPEKVRRLLEHELELIAQLRYEAYFLTVYDLVRFARSRGILCQGRGSAANSAVCFCLGVTPVDPERMDVLFERFISRERAEAPDIDIDFEHERREEVLQYVYDKYGRDRAGITAEVITYRSRSAVRDVGKALGLSLDRVDKLSKSIDGYHEGQLAERSRDIGLDPESTMGRQLLTLVDELVGFPRHLGQHVGGMVITRGPLADLVPIENAAMPGRTVIQWNKDDLDLLGILKVDCLSLGMLTAIRKCLELVNVGVPPSGGDDVMARSPDRAMGRPLGPTEGLPERGRPAVDGVAWSGDHATTAGSLPPASCLLPPDLRPPISDIRHPASGLTLVTIPAEDPVVYDMICRADTMGVFQIESRAQMSMLPRLKPREYYDLVIEVAIVRPGPIQGDMVHPYLRRRAGDEAVSYPNETIREVLHKTLGVPLFQEQAMRLAVVAAGFTPGEADQLRRAMGAWRRTGVIEQFRKKLIDGMLARGLALEFAEQVFHQIRGFGEYGFPESHAASFALLVYASAWLKCYHPAAFCCALINSQPMGFYAPAQLVRDFREHDGEVRGVDVNFSDWDCTLERGKGQGVRDKVGVPALAGEPVTVIVRSADRATTTASCLLPPASSPALRLGMRMLLGLREADARRIMQARRAGTFQSLDEFVRRTKLSRSVVALLSEADAFGSLTVNRRDAMWQALALDQRPDRTPLFDDLSENESSPSLPPLLPHEEVVADYQTAGLSLRAHPVQFHRPQLNAMGIAAARKLAELKDGCFVRVAGLVLVRQRPGTAKGITFVTLEDETGVANLIIRQDVWQRFHRAARTAAALIAHGRLQNSQGVIHVLVSRLDDLSDQLKGLGSQSRDFR